jgi:hypothetical protein
MALLPKVGNTYSQERTPGQIERENVKSRPVSLLLRNPPDSLREV